MSSSLAKLLEIGLVCVMRKMLLLPPSVDALCPELSQLREGGSDNKASLVVPTKSLWDLIARLLTGWPFDEQWYHKAYPDVATAVQSGKVKSAQDHYVEHGYIEGRLPVEPEFDAVWYVKRYPDVAQGIAAGKIKGPFEHYLSHGYREGRIPSEPTPGSEETLGGIVDR